MRWCSIPTDGSLCLSRKRLWYVLQLLKNKYFHNLETPNHVLLLRKSKNENQRYGENCVSAIMKGGGAMQYRYFLNIVFGLFGKKNAKFWQGVFYLLIQKVYNENQPHMRS